jgi:hypothetical protein
MSAYTVKNEEELKKLSFHDCFIYGMSWNAEKYSFSFDIDYILEWIDPKKSGDGYTFKVSKGTLIFENVSQIYIELDWGISLPTCQLEKISILESVLSPNGTNLLKWGMDFSTPDGEISFLATNFELQLIEDPVISKSQNLR